MPTAADLLRSAREPGSRSGRTIATAELRAAFNEAKRPQPGDPVGKPITAEEAALFAAINANELTAYARNNVLPGILAEIPALLQGSVPGGAVKVLPEKRGNAVFLSTTGGFAVDALGTAPASQAALVSTMHTAGKYLQACFGSGENLFHTAGLDTVGKRAVLAQLSAALTDPSVLTAPQQEQLLGSIAALTTELIKSIEFMPQVPAQNAELIALRDEALGLLTRALDDSRMSVLVERGVVGYLAKSDSFLAKLTPAQRTDITETRHDALFPTSPVDYKKWEAAGKDRIVIDHCSGQGENFVFGFVKQLQNDGLNGGRFNSPKFALISGDTTYGPCVLEAKVPANHPLNKWGREMTVEIRVREFRGDMYAAMGDEDVDVVHYGGHSNFGNNTLHSLQNAPEQKGDKVVLRDLCAGSDTKNAEAHKYPEASLNAVTSVGSSYFRTTQDPAVGTYAYASEGFEMLMSVTRGILGKADWEPAIATDLEERANWYGHASTNNWTHPGDPRAGAMVDSDKDGVPNVFDLLPGYNTSEIAASTAAEFQLVAPAVAADSISGTRVFQALQFANTAASYNAGLDTPNSERRLHADPTGIFFDAKDAPNEYLKFRRGPAGEHFVQYSTALADMTIESLRAVTFFELAKQLGRENPGLFASDGEANAMALVFASAALKYDDSWRDAAIFDGLKRLYGIPASVTLSEVERRRGEADDTRHNYTGDMQAARDVLAAQPGLGAAGVGRPAVTVTV